MATQLQQRLLKALQKIDRPGAFSTSGPLPSVLPGLEVQGMGAVALPLDKRDAAALKKCARQAPYGKGTRTVVDTSVRRVWEIDAEQVVLANPGWESVVKDAVQAAQVGLGLETQKLQAHLYKLLVYETGSFFLAHRDGEKLDGMIATLVIALPSAHEGGELIVRHEGREVTIDFGPQSRFQTQFAAFYADCEHEIRPVTSGFRLALIYNLTVKKSSRTISAPTSGEHIAAVSRILRDWPIDFEKPKDPSESRQPNKLAVLLDHSYSQAGMSYELLKGVDRAKVDVLFEAARLAECEASLAIVTYWQSGSAEPTGNTDGSGWHDRYEDDYFDDDDDNGGEDDDDDEEGSSSRYNMSEVYDESMTAEGFIDSKGNQLAFGQIPIADDELVSKISMEETKPDKEDFEGYTGNAGMTLERWYRRAAVLVWPIAFRFDVRCDAGVEAAVGGLQQMIKQWQQATGKARSTAEQSCLQFANRIISRWPERNVVYRYGDSSPQVGLHSLLGNFDDAKLVAAWIRNVLARDASVDPGRTLGDLCRQHGWLTFEDELRNLFEKTSRETMERQARMLGDIALRKDKNADRKTLAIQLTQRLLSVLERLDSKSDDRNWQHRTVDLKAVLSPLVQACIALDQNSLLEQLVRHVLGKAKEFDLTTVQAPVLIDLEAWFRKSAKHAIPALHLWLNAVQQELESRKSHPPEQPNDWRRASAVKCRCADCKALSQFLDDPDAEILRLPLAQERRRHLHQCVDQNKFDTSHVTERHGRPFTLVFTKNQASYERTLLAYNVDLDLLDKVRSLVDWQRGLK